MDRCQRRPHSLCSSSSTITSVPNIKSVKSGSVASSSVDKCSRCQRRLCSLCSSSSAITEVSSMKSAKNGSVASSSTDKCIRCLGRPRCSTSSSVSTIKSAKSGSVAISSTDKCSRYQGRPHLQCSSFSTITAISNAKSTKSGSSIIGEIDRRSQLTEDDGEFCNCPEGPLFIYCCYCETDENISNDVELVGARKKDGLKYEYARVVNAEMPVISHPRKSGACTSGWETEDSEYCLRKLLHDLKVDKKR